MHSVSFLNINMHFVGGNGEILLSLVGWFGLDLWDSLVYLPNPASNLLCSQVWPQIADSAPSTSQGLELKVWATMPGLNMHFLYQSSAFSSLPSFLRAEVFLWLNLEFKFLHLQFPVSFFLESRNTFLQSNLHAKSYIFVCLPPGFFVCLIPIYLDNNCF